MNADNTESSTYLDILYQKREPILYEEADWFVLLAKKPCNEGHLLVVPKLKEPLFFNLPPQMLARGFQIGTEMSHVLKDIYGAPRIALYIKGFSADDHVHIHVTSLYKSTETDVNPDAHELTNEEMITIASKIQEPIRARLTRTS